MPFLVQIDFQTYFLQTDKTTFDIRKQTGCQFISQYKTGLTRLAMLQFNYVDITRSVNNFYDIICSINHRNHLANRSSSQTD